MGQPTVRDGLTNEPCRRMIPTMELLDPTDAEIRDAYTDYLHEKYA
jgi:hypothetical protein